MPILIETFESQILKDNPLHDTPVRTIPVYLPEEAAANPQKRYPLLFAFPSFTGTGLSFLNYDFYRPNLPQMLDQLIAAQKMMPCVCVMIDSMTSLGGNQYVDSTAVGSWASHIVNELIPWAEERLPVLRGREHRGAFGTSSGGYGSMQMGMNHAEHFAAFASHAGDCAFEYCYLPDIPQAVGAFRSIGSLKNWFDSWRHHNQLPGYLFPLLNVVALSAFYSPNPASEYGFDLPFDQRTGAFLKPVFERWLEHDPVRMVESRSEALKRMRLIYIDAGEHDEYNLQQGAYLLHCKLEDLHLEHRFELCPGGHRGIGYRFAESLPLLSKALQ